LRQRPWWIAVLLRYAVAFLILETVFFALRGTITFVPETERWIDILCLASLLAGTVTGCLLAAHVISPVFGTVLGLANLVPCLGAAALLLICWQAAAMLNEHGVEVGWLGANPDSI